MNEIIYFYKLPLYCNISYIFRLQIYKVPGFFMLWVSFWKLMFLMKPAFINYLCREIRIKIII